MQKMQNIFEVEILFIWIPVIARPVFWNEH